MEWTVFTVIGAVFAFLAAVVSPIIKLNTTITKLSVNVDTIVDKITSTEIKNGESHDRIWKELETHETAIADHEKRILIIENKGEH